MQKIKKITNYLLLIILVVSFFFVDKNDKLYHCITIGVENDSLIFYLAYPEGENNTSVKKYVVEGNDYSKSLKKAVDEGIDIDMTVLKSICLSDSLTNENKNRFYSYAKNVFDLSCLVYICDCDILLEKDVMGSDGAFAIYELYGKNNGGVLFIDVLYKRETPPVIIFNGEKFIKK